MKVPIRVLRRVVENVGNPSGVQIVHSSLFLSLLFHSSGLPGVRHCSENKAECQQGLAICHVVAELVEPKAICYTVAGAPALAVALHSKSSYGSAAERVPLPIYSE